MRIAKMEPTTNYYAIVTDNDLWAVFDDEAEANEWNMSFDDSPVGEVVCKSGDELRRFANEIVYRRKVAEGYVFD